MTTGPIRRRRRCCSTSCAPKVRRPPSFSSTTISRADTAAIVRRMFDEGHAVALHSNQRWLMLGSAERIADQLRDAADRIEQLAGMRPCPLFRPHAGWRSAAMYGALDPWAIAWPAGAGRCGTGTGGDRARASAIAARLARRANDGDIIVIHDGHHIDPAARSALCDRGDGAAHCPPCGRGAFASPASLLTRTSVSAGRRSGGTRAGTARSAARRHRPAPDRAGSIAPARCGLPARRRASAPPRFPRCVPPVIVLAASRSRSCCASSSVGDICAPPPLARPGRSGTPRPSRPASPSASASSRDRDRCR